MKNLNLLNATFLLLDCQALDAEFEPSLRFLARLFLSVYLHYVVRFLVLSAALTFAKSFPLLLSAALTLVLSAALTLAKMFPLLLFAALRCFCFLRFVALLLLLLLLCEGGCVACCFCFCCSALLLCVALLLLCCFLLVATTLTRILAL